MPLGYYKNAKGLCFNNGAVLFNVEIVKTSIFVSQIFDEFRFLRIRCICDLIFSYLFFLYLIPSKIFSLDVELGTSHNTKLFEISNSCSQSQSVKTILSLFLDIVRC